MGRDDQVRMAHLLADLLDREGPAFLGGELEGTFCDGSDYTYKKISAEEATLRVLRGGREDDLVDLRELRAPPES